MDAGSLQGQVNALVIEFEIVGHSQRIPFETTNPDSVWHEARGHQAGSRCEGVATKA